MDIKVKIIDKDMNFICGCYSTSIKDSRDMLQFVSKFCALLAVSKKQQVSPVFDNNIVVSAMAVEAMFGLSYISEVSKPTGFDAIMKYCRPIDFDEADYKGFITFNKYEYDSIEDRKLNNATECIINLESEDVVVSPIFVSEISQVTTDAVTELSGNIFRSINDSELRESILKNNAELLESIHNFVYELINSFEAKNLSISIRETGLIKTCGEVNYIIKEGLREVKENV